MAASDDEQRLPTFLVDAFSVAGRPFSGNPAGVVLLGAGAGAGEPWMQAVAEEMRQAETAFLEPVDGDDEAGAAIRWFTPAAEVALCGHATLATVAALDAAGRLPAGPEPLRLRSRRSGVLLAGRGARDGVYRLTFPLLRTEPRDGPTDAEVAEMLGEGAGRPVWRGVCNTGGGEYDAVLELASPEHVRAVRPNAAAIARLLPDYRALCVTARGTCGTYDAVSRLFAPQVGVDEDTFTGSAHCYIAPHWAGRVGRDDNLRALQASPRQGEATLSVDRARGVVHLEGAASIFLRGSIAAAAP